MGFKGKRGMGFKGKRGWALRGRGGWAFYSTSDKNCLYEKVGGM